MRILMLNQEYPPIGGGAATATRQLVNQLTGRNIPIDLITMHYKGLPHYEEQGNLRIFRVPCRRQRADVSTVFELVTYLFSAAAKADKLVRQNHYDFVYAHFIVPSGFLAFYLNKRYGIRYLVHARGSDVMGYNPDRFGFIHKLIQPVNRKILKRANLIVAGSEYFAKLIQKQYGPHPVEILPNGFQGGDRTAMKKENMILFAGRLFARKGAQHLIRAIDGLPENWKCVIAGDGPSAGILKKLAANTKANIQFTGWLSKDELTAYYKKSSIFVFPSSAESFGMVLIEAMYYGNAVITLTGSACEEVVGPAGIILPDTDAETIRRYIFTLIRHPEQKNYLMKMSKKRADKFSWDELTNRYITVMEYYFMR